ncbi:MAG: MoaD/ThiS family protein [Firmicutes bacterium]|nr:MoaD/ThiS family protein [Bacillota bacterium]
MDNNEVEVRAFSFLKELFEEREWPFPLRLQLDTECSASELAQKLDLPLDKIEAVFINGTAQTLDQGMVRPGDRIAFVPPGTPGPYRVILGIVKGSDQQKETS